MVGTTGMGAMTTSPEDDGDPRPAASDATSTASPPAAHTHPPPLRIVVVGGGVAGVSAAREAALQCSRRPLDRRGREGGAAGRKRTRAGALITLVTASPILKETTVEGADEGDDDDDDDDRMLGQVRLDPVGVESWLADVRRGRDRRGGGNGGNGVDGGDEEDDAVRIEVMVGTVRGVDVLKRTVRVLPHCQNLDVDVDGTSTCGNGALPAAAAPPPVTLMYDRLCLSVGSSPVSPLPLDWTEEILTVRDTTSVTDLARICFRRRDDEDEDDAEDVDGDGRRRIVLFGNGAIALELAHALTGGHPVDPDPDDGDDDAPIVTWIVRDRYVGHAMLDAGSAALLMPGLPGRLLGATEDFQRPNPPGRGRGGDDDPTAASSSGSVVASTSSSGGDDGDDGDDVGPRPSTSPPARQRPSTAASETTVTTTATIPGTALGPDWGRHWTRAAREAMVDSGEGDGQGSASAPPPPPSKQPHELGGRRGGCPCCAPGRGVFVVPPKGDESGETSCRDDGGHESAAARTPPPPREGDGGGEGRGRGRRLDVRYETEILAVRRRSDPMTWVPVGTASGTDDGTAAAVLVRRASRERVGPIPDRDRLELLLSDGTYLSAEAVVSATGVSPAANVDAVLGGGGDGLGDRGVLARGADGGLVVDGFMRCRLRRRPGDDSASDGRLGGDGHDGDEDEIDLGVYAAGDCADCSVFEGSVSPPSSDSDSDSDEHDDDNDVSLWHQMRLWTQARAGGIYAGRCMVLGGPHAVEETGGSFACGFETFRHVTEFLGWRVTLLGLFNGQKCLSTSSSSSSVRGGGGRDDDDGGRSSSSVDLLSGFVPNPNGGGLLSVGGTEWREFLQCGIVPDGGDPSSSGAGGSGEDVGWEGSVAGKDESVVIRRMDLDNDIEVQTRLTAGVEYIKIILSCGRIVGAMVVGESDMGETIENLMLSRINVNALGFSLLDPDFDIGDIFD